MSIIDEIMAPGRSPMTWEEFKKAVEEAGVSDNDRVSYIDCGSFWPLRVSIGEAKDEGSARMFSVT